MSKLSITLLVISLLASMVAVFVMYKAIGYRSALNAANERLSNAFTAYSSRNTHLASNRELADGKSHPRRVVFLGASITEAWDLEQTFPEIEPVNRGVYGNKVGGYLLRFKSDVLDLKPRAAVIKICSINFRPAGSVPLEEMQDYITSMADLARAHEIEPILATTVPIRRDGERYGDYSVTGNIKLYNSWLKGYASGQDLKIIDYYDAMADDAGFMPDDISSDHIHPNAAGYELMAEAARQVIMGVMAN